MNYQKWKIHITDELNVPPSDLWWDAKCHYWWRKGTFTFLCGAYGAVYETFIGSRFFRLYSYNKPVGGSLQHLLTIENGKWIKIHTCSSTEEAQSQAHEYKGV